MSEILFLEPVFQARIWGGRALEEVFNYDIPAGSVGECWGISAHPNGESLVKSGRFKGKKISELWTTEPGLFGNPKEEKFPLLVKILDANDDLSVQVHPDDTYANEHENGELGKTECWYILDAKPGAKIIYGHHAQTKEQAEAWISGGKWNEFLREIPVKKGDFFYVPAGTIHAIGEGCLILEVQQSSDTTYRLYDYDRLGDDGKPRELHIEKSIDVSVFPHVDAQPEQRVVLESENVIAKELVNNAFFSVVKYDVKQGVTLQSETYALISVIEGSGTVNGLPIKKGDHFIVPANVDATTFSGQMELIVAQPS